MSEPTVPERIETATAAIEADSAVQHAIVHGADDAADVMTENGPVKTLAKVAKEGEDNFDAAVANIAFQAQNYLGDITTLNQALVAPASNLSKWYSVLIAGTLTGTNSGGLVVAVGDLIFSDGTSAWAKRGTLPVLVTRAQLETRLQEITGNVYSHSGYAYAIIDANNRMALAIDMAGNIIGKFQITDGTIIAAKLETSVQNRIPTEAWSTLALRIAEALDPATHDQAYAIVDSNNRIAFAIDKAGNITGKFVLADLSVTYAKLSADVQAKLAIQLDNVEYAYAIVDANDKLAFGIKKDGTVYIAKFQLPNVSIDTAQLADGAVTRAKHSLLEQRLSLNQALDVVPVKPDDWRFKDSFVSAKTEFSGSGWARFPETITRLVRGVNASGQTLQFRKSNNLVIRGKQYIGTFDPTSATVASTNYKGDKTNGATWPPVGTFASGDYYYFVDSAGFLDVTAMNRGDLMVYSGSAWAKQSRPAIVNEGDWFIVSAVGTYDGASLPALAIGDRLVYMGFQSNSGTGKIRFMVETRTGAFFYKGEFNPAGGLPASPANGELYSASAAGSTGGFTFAQDDLLVREGGAWGQVTGETIKTVANGAYVALPCVNDSSEWEVRRSDKSASQANIVLNCHRSTIARRHHDNIIFWGDSMPGKVSASMAVAFSTRTVTTQSFGGATSRNVLTMAQRYLATLSDPYAGLVALFWHGQNNQSDPTQTQETCLRLTQLIGARDNRYLHLSVMGQRNMTWNGSRLVCSQHEDQFNRVAGNILTILDFLEKTFPNNYFDTRAQLCAALYATTGINDLQFPGMTELQVATTYGIVPLSFFFNYSLVAWNPNTLNFVGYRSTAGLPSGGSPNDYYLRTANGTVGAIIVNVATVWTEYTYDSTHLYSENTHPGNTALANALFSFITTKGW